MMGGFGRSPRRDSLRDTAVMASEGGGQNRTIPNALAELEVGAGQFSWRVKICPFCQKGHVHGGGLLGQDDPRRFLGFRVAHCIRKCQLHVASYKLIDADPSRTEKILRGCG